MKKPIRKKSLTKTLWKKAFKSCERALIAAVNRRDKVCQLCKCQEVLQTHHAITSRKHKSTFFEIRQMVLLCSRCHTNVTFKNFGMDIEAAAIVAEREGLSYVEYLQRESRRVKKWEIAALEQMTREFERIYL